MSLKLPKYVDPSAYRRKLTSICARLILSMGIPLRVKTSVGSHSILFFVNSFLEYHLRAKQGYNREPITVKWILEVIHEDDIVFDIGANVGTYSLLMGKKMQSGAGQVFAFEPEASNFLSLNENIKLNKLGSRIIAYPIAFSDSSRTAHLFLSSNVRGSACHSIAQPESEGNRYAPQHTQGIYVLSVDNFCAENNVPMPNHVKIDVDGAEFGILQGMKEVLENHELKTIMIEITEKNDGTQVEEKIINSGFKELDRQLWKNKKMANVLYGRE